MPPGVVELLECEACIQRDHAALHDNAALGEPHRRMCVTLVKVIEHRKMRSTEKRLCSDEFPRRRMLPEQWVGLFAKAAIEAFNCLSRVDSAKREILQLPVER